jgi:arylsulfatase A-like enzyme
LAKNKGYTTACIGKWHLGMNFYQKNSNEYARGKTTHEHGKGGYRNVDFTRDAAYSPNDIGFDFSFVSGAGHNMEPFCFIKNRSPYYNPTEWREAKTPTLPGSSGRESHEGWMTLGWTDEMVDMEFTKQAVNFIERSVTEKPNRPFFLYFTPVAPHRPCVPVNKFRGSTGLGLREDFVAEYDWEVGQIMKILDSLKITNNTLIIVTSDNGAVGGGKGHHSNGKLRGGKTSLFEGGHRVPFIVRWPEKIEGGSVNDTPIALSGLLATMAGLFEYEIPDNVGEDSHSFLNALLGVPMPDKSLIIHHSYGGNLAIRYGNWKLLPGNKMLFNMAKDPYEKNNIYDQYPNKVKELYALLMKTIDTGRSTPGNNQKNTPDRKGVWKQYEQLRALNLDNR